mmetsp:Transcript_16668/g.23487  ORF Transcript_16668/g.23487 Transcript_16668/m.23487 type:complete len:130 (-) Transcript_16668:338-727(-)
MADVNEDRAALIINGRAGVAELSEEQQQQISAKNTTAEKAVAALERLDENYKNLHEKEQVLLEAYEKLKEEEKVLESALRESASLPDRPITKLGQKKQKQAAALERLTSALLMESSGNSSSSSSGEEDE